MECSRLLTGAFPVRGGFETTKVIRMTNEQAAKELSNLRDYLIRNAERQKRSLAKSEAYLFDAIQVALRAIESVERKDKPND